MSPTSKIGNLVGNFTHQIREVRREARLWVFKISPAFAKWNVIRVLALGSLMVLGVAMYFNIASGAADTASQNNQLENPFPGGEPQTTADPGDQMLLHSLSEDLRFVPDDEWMDGQPDYEVARAANFARREAEAEVTMQRVEAYIARNKAIEAGRAANQAAREAEARATMRRVEAYIAANKASEQ